MVATTVRDLVVGALEDCGAFGVGMPPPADAADKGLKRLNWMISEWNRKRWLVYRIRDLSAPANGALSYSVGPGATFDSIGPRPARVSYAFLRQNTNSSAATEVDYPLKIITAREDYAQIRLKNLASWPYAAFYDPVQGTGQVYFWPRPQAPYELHIGIPEILLRYDSLDDDLALPEEYESAVYHNLLIRLGMAYRIPQSSDAQGLAKNSLNVLRDANNAIATLHMPRVLQRTGSYNIYSDNN